LAGYGGFAAWNPGRRHVTEGSDNDVSTSYGEFERKTVDAFNRWHGFHEDLLKLGDFSTWLSDQENQVDLVTFFALDKENRESFNDALTNQIEFLAAMQGLMESTMEMLATYETGEENNQQGD
jgi:hypothetical protein